jgi:hypothetical protein
LRLVALLFFPDGYHIQHYIGIKAKLALADDTVQHSMSQTQHLMINLLTHDMMAVTAASA